MSGQTQPDSFRLKDDLDGRIANLAMAPSQANTLIPLFEAIMNSLHAVQDRFGAKWINQCKIEIRILEDEEEKPHSFIVKDNGIGLDSKHFDSFRTYDSRANAKKGGKGVGRLTWLKVFEYARVSSIFKEDGKPSKRQFEFVLHNLKTLQKHSLDVTNDETHIGTVIELRDLKSKYRSICPKKLDTIAHRIAAHFLPFLIRDEKPSIRIKASSSQSFLNLEEGVDLANLVTSNVFEQKTETFKVENVGTFSIKHLLINKTLVEKNEHTVYLAAHERIVSKHVINNQTGLDKPILCNNKQTFYVGIVSSKHLDNNVTQERNNFDIEEVTFKAITKRAEEAAKKYLHKPIALLIKKKAETIGKVITEFPRYAYLAKNPGEFAKKLPLNRKTEEEIYQDMALLDHRTTRDVKRTVDKFTSKSDTPTDAEEFQAKLDALMERIGQQERSSLAEYVGKRKLVIELLNSRLGHKEKDKKKYYTEKDIHSIICPLHVNSGDIAYGNHNLWLIDDRLAYYDFWASDQSIRSFTETSEAKARPDLILFQGSHLLRREGTKQPIVIIEFKRPSLESYTEADNPVKQVYEYIRELRKNKVKDNSGAFITEITPDTPFFCYLVCNINPPLEALLENHNISQPLPGKRGYFGYNDKLCAYIEVLQYSELVKDAHLRHKAFFTKLGID